MQADFFAEEVRRNLLAAYGEKGLYEGGLSVTTTLDPAIQAVADRALRQGLMDYDRRHGWRGPHAKIADMNDAGWEAEFARIAQRRPLFGPPSWQLAVVTMAMLLTWWFRSRPWYRSRIVLPLSLVIATIAVAWTIQRIAQ